jgi:hypothetical protein
MLWRQHARVGCVAGDGPDAVVLLAARVVAEEQVAPVGTAELDLSIWSMAVEPVVLAPVLGEPSLPAMTPAALDISPSDLDRVKARIGAEGLTIRGYRLHGDTLAVGAKGGDGRAGNFAAGVRSQSARQPWPRGSKQRRGGAIHMVPHRAGRSRAPRGGGHFGIRDGAYLTMAGSTTKWLVASKRARNAA